MVVVGVVVVVELNIEKTRQVGGRGWVAWRLYMLYVCVCVSVSGIYSLLCLHLCFGD